MVGPQKGSLNKYELDGTCAVTMGLPPGHSIAYGILGEVDPVSLHPLLRILQQGPHLKEVKKIFLHLSHLIRKGCRSLLSFGGHHEPVIEDTGLQGLRLPICS